MSAESVRAWLAEHAPDLPIIETELSTATVETAAMALGVEPGRIAKTLAVRVGDRTILLVARSDGDEHASSEWWAPQSLTALSCSFLQFVHLLKRRLKDVELHQHCHRGLRSRDCSHI